MNQGVRCGQPILNKARVISFFFLCLHYEINAALHQTIIRDDNQCQNLPEVLRTADQGASTATSPIFDQPDKGHVSPSKNDSL